MRDWAHDPDAIPRDADTTRNRRLTSGGDSARGVDGASGVHGLPDRSVAARSRQRSATLNGEPLKELVVTALDLDGDASADLVVIPDSVRSAFTTRMGFERAAIGW